MGGLNSRPWAVLILGFRYISIFQRSIKSHYTHVRLSELFNSSTRLFHVLGYSVHSQSEVLGSEWHVVKVVLGRVMAVCRGVRLRLGTLARTHDLHRLRLLTGSI